MNVFPDGSCKAHMSAGDSPRRQLASVISQLQGGYWWALSSSPPDGEMWSRIINTYLIARGRISTRSGRFLAVADWFCSRIPQWLASNLRTFKLFLVVRTLVVYTCKRDVRCINRQCNYYTVNIVTKHWLSSIPFSHLTIWKIMRFHLCCDGMNVS
jgi:hypothetical protein